MDAVLVTDRLTLRPPRAADAAEISALCSDWQVARNLAEAPWPNPPEAVRAFFAQAREEGRLALVIDDGAPQGMVELGGHLGYWLGRRAWGRGYAAEAAAAMVAHAFDATGREEIRSGVFAGNEASLRVLEKLGFRRTGISRQFCRARGAHLAHIDMALSRADWTERRSAT